MRPPLSVLAAILFHALWLPAAIANIVRDAGRHMPVDAGSAALAACYCAVALYGLLKRTSWARLFTAISLGSMSLAGWAIFAVLLSQRWNVLQAWPLWVILGLVSVLALALALGRAEKRYFAAPKRAGEAPPETPQPAVAADAPPAPPDIATRVYRPNVAAFARYRRRALVFTLVALPMGIGAGFWIGTRILGPLDMTGTLVLVSLMAVGAAWGVRVGFGRMQARFLASEWTVGGDLVAHRIPGRQPIEIHRADVRRIEESNVDLVVRGAKPSDAIAIPVGLDGFAEIRACLSQWASFEPATPIGLQWAYSMVLGLGAAVSPWLAFGGFSVALVVAAGLIQLGAAIWGWWGFRTGRLSDPRASWAAWVGFVPGALMLVRAYYMWRV
jgi:hypothetical protein